MQDYNIEAGDRVTYKYKGESDIFTRIITINSDTEITLKDDKEILKIERIGSNGWDTVYEKEEELLTEEEREFLKDMIKHYDITHILCGEDSIDLHSESHIVACLDYPKKLKFKNIQDKRYSLSELGLDEGE